jgi:hypothetical protein
MRSQGFHPRQCTAKSKRSGERCKNYACRGRGTCRMHGGKSPRGIGHPNTKHGMYSKGIAAIVGAGKLCPRCATLHGTVAEKEREKRAHTRAFQRGYAMGRQHGFSDGRRHGLTEHQRDMQKAQRRARRARKAHSIIPQTLPAAAPSTHEGEDHAR